LASVAEPISVPPWKTLVLLAGHTALQVSTGVALFAAIRGKKRPSHSRTQNVLRPEEELTAGAGASLRSVLSLLTSADGSA
jgi:hypothetical protein